MQSIYNLDCAQNAKDIKEALSHWGSPTQNFAYATTGGDYGMISPGYYPILKDGEPWLLLSGTGECDWASLIPYEHVPSAINPERKYVSSANERQVGRTYPYKIGSSVRICQGRMWIFSRLFDLGPDEPLHFVLGGYLLSWSKNTLTC